MTSTYRLTEVRLGVYGPTGKKILNLLHKRWASSLKKLKCLSADNCGLMYKTRALRFSEDNDGGAVVKFGTSFVSGWFSNDSMYFGHAGFARYHDDPQGIRHYLALEITTAVNTDHAVSFSPANTEKISLYDGKDGSQYCARVNEILCLIEFLGGQSNLEEVFGKSVYNKVIGSAKDPIATELRGMLSEEIAKIRRKTVERKRAANDEYSADEFRAQKKLWEEQQQALDRYRAEQKRLREIRSGKYAEFDKDERAEIAALRKSMKPA